MTPLAVPVGGSSGHDNSTLWLVVGLVLVVVGVLRIARPDLWWRLRRWRERDTEATAPTDAALTFTRVVGAIIAVAGVVVIVLAVT